MTRTLIGLSGYAGAGKDTAAANMPGYTRFAFADPLKADLAPLLAMIGCTITDPGDKAKIRPLLVEWGRSARSFDPDFWISRTFRAIGESGTDRVVITDVRYPNEVSAILARDGTVVRIDRPGISAANDEELLSIAGIDRRFPTLPHVFNDGTPEELGCRILDEICRKAA